MYHQQHSLIGSTSSHSSHSVASLLETSSNENAVSLGHLSNADAISDKIGDVNQRVDGLESGIQALLNASETEYSQSLTPIPQPYSKESCQALLDKIETTLKTVSKGATAEEKPLLESLISDINHALSGNRDEVLQQIRNQNWSIDTELLQQRTELKALLNMALFIVPAT